MFYSHLVVVDQSRSTASSEAVMEAKEQWTQQAESSSGDQRRWVSWWKILTQRSVHDKTGVVLRPEPRSPVHVTAADVMKTPRDETAPRVKASDATFYWRM
ncbi:hypothetical protein M758_8G077700 [Ceratodon purpureus]|nr:hypothetical protein M758_8G077700 [Ceratodon purpureus]